MKPRTNAPLLAGLGALAIFAVMSVASEGLVAQSAGGDSDVTFAADVAPILQENCQTCHNPEGIGPMSLLTYEEARPFAPLIREKVVTRAMPPWHVDKNVGIQEFKNDVFLSDEEIRTIVAWVDGGAPFGDPSDLPAPVVWPTGADWRLE